MDLRLSDSGLSDIYMAANTPLYLFDCFRKNDVVQNLAQSYTTHELIELFFENAKKPITKMDELAAIYAYFIALTFKADEEAINFFKKVLAEIKFEWFGVLAKYYLNNNQQYNANSGIEVSSEDSSNSQQVDNTSYQTVCA